MTVIIITTQTQLKNMHYFKKVLTFKLQFPFRISTKLQHLSTYRDVMPCYVMPQVPQVPLFY